MSVRCFHWFAGLVFVIGPLPAYAGDKTGKSLYPRPLPEIRKTLGAILKFADPKADDKTQALRRLKAYRFLAGVPYEDLILDEEYNQACLAGAKLCEKLGKSEHKPMNPGMPEAEFKLAYKGTSSSNLGRGHKSLVQAVDSWMDDSDDRNIDRLGYRRWCLNPSMAKTGFGRSGVFSAMYTFDRGRKTLVDYDFICWPARGYMPISFFGPKHAWNVSLNPAKYKAPGMDFTPKIYQADAKGAKKGKPLKLNYQRVDTVGFGIPNCIIFRPENLALVSGARYVVELDGIEAQAADGPAMLRYVVEFVN